MSNKITIGTKVTDTHTGKEQTVIGVTSNSFNVTLTKLTEKGINCTNWFEGKSFYSRFKINNK